MIAILRNAPFTILYLGFSTLELIDQLLNKSDHYSPAVDPKADVAIDLPSPLVLAKID